MRGFGFRDIIQIISLSCFVVVLVLLPRKARIDAPGVLHQIKGFVSKLEEICSEVTRRTLQQDLTNLIDRS